MEKKETKPINQISKNSGCWLSGYLLSEKITDVRVTDNICCGVFFLFCRFFLPTLFCRLSVVWIDSCIEIAFFGHIACCDIKDVKTQKIIAYQVIYI